MHAWDVAADGRFIMARRLTQNAGKAASVVVTGNLRTPPKARMKK